MAIRDTFGEWSGLIAAVLIGMGIILVAISGPPLPTGCPIGVCLDDPYFILYGAAVMLAGLGVGFLGDDLR